MFPLSSRVCVRWKQKEEKGAKLFAKKKTL